MKIINAGYEILRPNPLDGIAELKHLELCARTAYKSEDKITEDGESAKRMIKRLIESGHESTLEHGGMTVKFTVDRGVSHEIVRHRLASYTQESTRYCNYSKDKFGNEITVIRPCFFEDYPVIETDEDGYICNIQTEVIQTQGFQKYYSWFEACETAEEMYFYMLNKGGTPQEARSVLPNSLKTEVVMTANWREWRHFLKLRSAPDAHPQIREVAIPLLNELHEKIPVLFDDIWENCPYVGTMEA